MARAHFWIGCAALAAFIATGIYLRLYLSDLAAHNDSIRWMFRSNHIYILMSGLVNLALSRDTCSPVGWRARARVFGSVLTLAAPIILLAAFIREPAIADTGRALTRLGVVALAIGTVARVIVARPRA